LVKAKRELIGNEVITENEARLGEVRDYEFNPDTFALTSLTVPPGMNVVGEILTIAGDKILTIGEDVIVVAADVVMRLMATADSANLPVARAPADMVLASSIEPN